MTPSPWQKTLRSSVRALAHWLWPPTPEQEEQVYQARLTQELHIRQQLLVDLCRRGERCRDRLAELQKDELRLSRQIQLHADRGDEVQTECTVRALERNRKAQVRTRERLQRGLQKYQRAHLRFEQLKRQRVD